MIQARTYIYELDAVRVIAAAFIILTHIWYFTLIGTELKSAFNILGIVGLTIFFFLSGFFVVKESLITKQDVGLFWRKKFIRILPAMYVAIIFYIVVESLNLGALGWDAPINIWSILSNLLCLQVFFLDLRFFAFWYIGALFVMYLIHIFVQRLSDGDIGRYMIWSTFLFILILPLYSVDLSFYGFNFDTRVIDYYFVFFFGSLSGLIIKNERPQMFICLLGTLFGFFFFQKIIYALGYNYKLVYAANLPVFIPMLSLILFLCITHKGLYTPMPSLPKTIQKASYASYSTYLFHYPILCLLIAAGLQNPYVFICISIPLAFVMGYILQLTIDIGFASVVTYLTPLKK